MTKVDLTKARDLMKGVTADGHPETSVLAAINAIIDAIDPPKPESFDWKDVRPGMAFKTIDQNLVYTGTFLEIKNGLGGYQVWMRLSDTCPDRSWNLYCSWRPEELERAPEHDKP